MQSLFFLALLAGVAASDVTPIEKVVTLIKGLRDEVVSDGKTEAGAYDKFACFCKSTTGKKSKSVQSGTKKIGVLSADIADKTQEQTDDSTELKERKTNHEKLNTKLDETKERMAKEKAAYDLEAADLSKAIQGLKDAIKSMQDSKPSLLQIKKDLGNVFEMAEAMSLLKTPKHKATAALLQGSAKVDPSDPEYKFHSNDIIELCQQLLKDYSANKKTLDSEYNKAKKANEELVAATKKALSANKKAMDALEKNIEKLAKEIAQHHTDLVTAESTLKDDEQYLNELQKRCQERANDYDQRSAMRADELSALNTALDVLSNKVSKETAVNQRALLIQKPVAAKAEAKKVAVAAPVKQAVAVEAKKVVAPAAKESQKKPISFLQLRGALSLEVRQEKALEVLRSEGQRLSSSMINALVENAAADPFVKVKGLIQKLIERLLAESAAEASKKGFCDTELGKARKDRDFRYEEATDLSAELAGLQAKRDELTAEIKQLKKEIKEESEALKETTKERNDEKAANLKTLKTAKDGLAGVSEALLVLRSFYKQAAKATAFVQASPLDEDTAAGELGKYGGKQDGMKSVFALLETIQSDFDRTIRTTEKAEDQSHRDYVDFQQAAESSLAEKNTKKDLDEQDLKTTNTSIAQKTDDMQTAVDLLDSALKELEKLSPTCIDTGMSYSERVKKRKEEMDALKKALCILDEDNVEPECKR